MKIVFFKNFLSILGLLFIANFCISQTPRSITPAYNNSIKVNYIRTWEAVVPETNSANIATSATPDKFRMTTQYIDGLGRPIQTVIKQSSLITGQSPKDMVSIVEYDEFGREQFQYLPSPANNTGSNTHLNDGLFKLNPFQQQATFYNNTNGDNPLKGQGETFFYGQTQFEPSPLNRVTKSLSPGNSWQGSNRG